MRKNKTLGFFKSLIFCGSFLFINSCGPLPISSLRHSQNQDPYWEKRFWLEKAQRITLYGETLDESKQQELATTKSKKEIIDFLFSDPRFSHAVLDFNYYFLNLKPNKIYELFYNENANGDSIPWKYYYLLGEKPTAAIASARAFARNENYFRLFDYEQPNFHSGIAMPCKIPSDATQNCTELLPANTPREDVIRTRQYWSDLAYAKYLSVFSSLQSLPDDASGDRICSALSILEYGSIFSYINYAGFYGYHVLPKLDQSLKGLSLCFYDQTLVTKSRVLKIFEKNLAPMEKLTHELIFHPSLEKRLPQNLSELEDLDLVPYGFPNKNIYDEFSFSFNFENSSTNFNRRRGAYILKTFFCDDLTPINIALPNEHKKGRHASDPACASCHYKLDPISGFFKNIGNANYDLTDESYFVFDDGKKLNQAEKDLYMNTWKNPEGTARAWNIGYIRSATDERLNRYGESPKDLHDIIKEAPEVKQCLTKRMAEYFLGKNQVFDGAWLHELTQKFEDAAKSKDPKASSEAFKEVAKEMLLSKTFAERNPDPSKCYDFKKGDIESAIPCEVSFNLEKNCVNCHKGSGAAKRLDFTSWTVDSSGKGVFLHLDENGNQLSASESFQRISLSLSSKDERKLMPYFKFMAPVERAHLFNWVNGKLQKP
jgi:hypothetical protein